MIYFTEQPNTRRLQIRVLKKKLEIKYDLLYKGKDIFHRHSYSHSQSCWVYNKLGDFVRIEDNSVRGFKKRCIASFH